MNTPATIRFWRFVKDADANACWIWQGQTNGRGYGKFNVTDHGKARAHRYAYEQLVAEIPEGLEIDHLCRTKLCVNPWHMEPVTPAINRRRQNAAHGWKAAA